MGQSSRWTPWILLALASAVSACKRGENSSGHAGAALSAVASSHTAASTTTPGDSRGSTGVVIGGQQNATGRGVSLWKDVDELKPCASRERELEPNLGFAGFGMGVSGKELGLTWEFATKTKGEGLVSFGGFDSQTRTLSMSYGLGRGLLAAPRVFPSGDGWTVTWFDKNGLVFTRATWTPALAFLSRVGAMGVDVAEHTAIASTKGGALLGAAPVGLNERAQLGLFLFAPRDPDTEPVRAIGATHYANNPKHPTVVEDNDGYVVAWEDESAPGALPQVVVTRFDGAGKELGAQRVLSNPAKASKKPILAATHVGSLVTWIEEDASNSLIVIRALDIKGNPLGPTYRVDYGLAPMLISVGEGAVLGFYRQARGVEGTDLLVVFVENTGKPSEEGLIVSDTGKGKKVAMIETPALGYTSDGRLATAFVYNPDMRGHLKTFLVEGCLQKTRAPNNDGP